MPYPLVTKVYRTKGDTLTPLGAQLVARNSTTGQFEAVSLTGRTVKFFMVDEDGAVKVAETATGVQIVDAANGKVTFDFSSSHVNTAGDFYGWFFVYQGAERDSYPVNGRTLLIRIVEAA